MTLMTTSKNGADFIKAFESLTLTGKRFVFNGKKEQYATIGYGHYGPDVAEGKTITEAEAVDLLRKDLGKFEKEVNGLHKNLTQGQFDALVSFIYNLGIANFNSSTLKKRILSEAVDEDIAHEFTKWVNAQGKPLNGLKRRRVAEANMFLGRELYYMDKDNNIKKRA